MNVEALTELIDAFTKMAIYYAAQSDQYAARAADFIGSPFELEELQALRDRNRGKADAYGIIVICLKDNLPPNEED